MKYWKIVMHSNTVTAQDDKDPEETIEEEKAIEEEKSEESEESKEVSKDESEEKRDEDEEEEKEVTSAEMLLYGDVVSSHPENWFTGEPEEGSFIAQDDFVKDMEKIKDVDELTVRINSGGGDLYTGMAIYSILKNMKAHVTVMIEGIAASAASLIASAGDTVKMAAGGLFMIHEPAALLADTYNIAELNDIIKMLDASGKAASEAYSRKSGLTANACRKLMQAETWMTGKEAREKGFVDELIDENVAMAMSTDKKSVVVNGSTISITDYHNLPSAIKEAEPKVKEVKVPDVITLDRVKNDAPDVFGKIASDAVENERKRIQEIDAIATQCSDELVLEAKYGETACTAEELALKAMNQQKARANEFLKESHEDVEMSGTTKVTAVPPSKDVDDKKEETMKGARLIAGTKKGAKKDGRK